ncbi:MAG: hypothetical protein LBB08_01215, partial [Rickettsiales bacterium]|nr:hypothetical protein [Rickettsiales bacterium]
MISANVKKFLDLVFASQAYANMPQEYKRGYSNLAANGLLDKKQAAWREADANLKKMESSGLDMDGIKYTFSSAELDELYALLLEMFRSMDANRTSFQKNKEANKFFDDNFGYSPAVPPVPKMFRAFEPDIKQLKSLGSTITSTTGKTDLELVFDQMKSVNPLSFGLSKNDFDKFTDSFYKPSTKTLNLIQLDSLKNKRMRDIFLSAIGAARQNINEIHSLLMDFQHAEADLLKAKRATKNITEQKMREILDKLNNVSRTTTPGVRYNRNDLGAASANIAEDLKNMIIVMDAANSINGALLTDVADKPNAFSIADAKKLLSSISKNAEIRDVAISNMQDPTFQRAVYNAERDNNYKDGENRIVPQ